MNLTTITDGVIVFCIAAAITIFQAIQELLTIFQKGIFRDEREILMKRKNKDLRQMLMGTEVKGINRLKKDQLVDLILA